MLMTQRLCHAIEMSNFITPGRVARRGRVALIDKTLRNRPVNQCVGIPRDTVNPHFFGAMGWRPPRYSPGGFTSRVSALWVSLRSDVGAHCGSPSRSILV